MTDYGERCPECSHYKEDHEELDRVWKALKITGYNGKSASENVSAILAELEALRAKLEPTFGESLGMGESA